MLLKDDLSPVEAPVAPDRHDPARCFPPLPESCEITLRCRRANYSASAIARAVEDCDAHLVNLNVTSEAPEPDIAQNIDDVIVDLRVNHRNALAVARSLERYGYDIIRLSGDDTPAADIMRDRIELLLHNLSI